MKTSTRPSVSPESCHLVQGSEARVWNSFRSSLAEKSSRQGRESPIQLADLMRSHEAAYAAN